MKVPSESREFTTAPHAHTTSCSDLEVSSFVLASGYEEHLGRPTVHYSPLCSQRNRVVDRNSRHVSGLAKQRVG